MIHIICSSKHKNPKSPSNRVFLDSISNLTSNKFIRISDLDCFLKKRPKVSSNNNQPFQLHFHHYANQCSSKKLRKIEAQLNNLDQRVNQLLSQKNYQNQNHSTKQFIHTKLLKQHPKKHQTYDNINECTFFRKSNIPLIQKIKKESGKQKSILNGQSSKDQLYETLSLSKDSLTLQNSLGINIKLLNTNSSNEDNIGKQNRRSRKTQISKIDRHLTESKMINTKQISMQPNCNKLAQFYIVSNQMNIKNKDSIKQQINIQSTSKNQGQIKKKNKQVNIVQEQRLLISQSVQEPFRGLIGTFNCIRNEQNLLSDVQMEQLQSVKTSHIL